MDRPDRPLHNPGGSVVLQRNEAREPTNMRVEEKPRLVRYDSRDLERKVEPMRERSRDRSHERRRQREPERRLRSKREVGKSGKRRSTNPDAPHQVRFKNVPSDLTAQDLHEALCTHVKDGLMSVDMLRDSHGRFTEEALVTMKCKKDAQSVAGRFHGGDLNGRIISVALE